MHICYLYCIHWQDVISLTWTKQTSATIVYLPIMMIAFITLNTVV